MAFSILKSKFKIIENIGTEILKIIFSAILGYIFSKASIKNHISPFSLSFLSIIPETKFPSISFYLASCLGYITKDFSPYNFKYIIANTIMYVIILIIGNKKIYKRVYSPIIPAVICLGTGIPFLFFENFLTFNLLLLIAESLLCGCISYFLRYLFNSFKRRTKFETKDYISLNITLIIFLCAVDKYYIFGTNVSYILVILFCYLSAEFLDIKTGIFFNITMCAIPAILHPQNAYSFILLYLPSVVTLLIAKYNKQSIPISYFLSYISVYIMNFDFSNLALISAPVYSAVIYLILPKNKLSDKTSVYFNVKNKLNKSKDYINEACKNYNYTLSQLLTSFENDIKTKNDKDSENKIKKFLQNNRCKCIDILFYYDDCGKMVISVSCKCEGMFSFEALKEKLETIFQKSFSLCSKSHDDKSVFCKYKQKDNFKVDCYALYKAKNGETICGDSVLAFKSSGGYYNMIIADGMGCGKEAFSKSNSAIMMLKKLFKYNVDIHTSIEAVNSSFDLINDEIGFSTVDICRISLNDASSKFIKCGAYKSYLVRKNELTTMASGGFPLGLDKTIGCTEQDIQLQSDDIIVMMSDGCVVADEFVQSLLLLSSKNKTEQLAHDIIDVAYKNTPKELDDDMTVMVAKITEY